MTTIVKFLRFHTKWSKFGTIVYLCPNKWITQQYTIDGTYLCISVRNNWFKSSRIIVLTLNRKVPVPVPFTLSWHHEKPGISYESFKKKMFKLKSNIIYLNFTVYVLYTGKHWCCENVVYRLMSCFCTIIFILQSPYVNVN